MLPSSACSNPPREFFCVSPVSSTFARYAGCLGSSTIYILGREASGSAASTLAKEVATATTVGAAMIFATAPFLLATGSIGRPVVATVLVTIGLLTIVAAVIATICIFTAWVTGQSAASLFLFSYLLGRLFASPYPLNAEYAPFAYASNYSRNLTILLPILVGTGLLQVSMRPRSDHLQQQP